MPQNQDRITDDGSQGGIQEVQFLIFFRNLIHTWHKPKWNSLAIGNLFSNNLIFDDFGSFNGDNQNKPPLNQELVLN